MKKNTAKKYIVFSILILSIGLSACSKLKSKSSDTSSKTGKSYKNAGIKVASKIKRGPGPGLIAIEGGTFVIGGSLNQDLGFENDNTRRRVTVNSFYMDETEVSNLDWMEYLYWLKDPANISNKADRDSLYYEALPDTLVWRRPLSYNEPWVTNYLRHPAYQDYPVVGVTWVQANEYCKWRTDRVNEDILRKKGYLEPYKKPTAATTATAGQTNTTTGSTAPTANQTNPTTAQTTPFNTTVYLNGQGSPEKGKNLKNLAVQKGSIPSHVRVEDGILQEPYRLPTEAEWEYAALAYAGNTSYENIEDGKIYPWNGMGVRSAKKRTQGLIMANFKRGSGDNMGTGGWLNDKAAITAPVKNYLPNDFGLYNMAGNVNEWTSDTYRKLSYEEFDDFNPYRGNQYVDVKRDSSGKVVIDKSGRALTSPAVSSKKLKYKDYKDQQKKLTATTPGQPTTASAGQGTAVAGFNADKRSVNQAGEKDGAQALYDQGISLVNDESKVYKGGSWNDRAAWLNPATRRFMQQDESSAEVGFRCAMTLVGDPQVTSKSGKPQFRKPKK
jgi:gliding motility-associated lipoprotein GldJ